MKSLMKKQEASAIVEEIQRLIKTKRPTQSFALLGSPPVTAFIGCPFITQLATFARFAAYEVKIAQYSYNVLRNH
jgi:hypothetical protein